ncbi:MAG: hypothetical protein H6540_08355 [Bacteroidales bacterium]|nr:hypothetical protein [Bacteroidales bacterium]
MKRSIFLYTLVLPPLRIFFGQQERKTVREEKNFRIRNTMKLKCSFARLWMQARLYEGEYDIKQLPYKQKEIQEAASEYEKLLEKIMIHVKS